MFAISYRPQKPELQPGEPLLLQLVSVEARKQGKEQARINFALIFDHLERDHHGTISRLHWPAEQRVWDWIIYASATVPTVPFSLEDLALSKAYDGQTNPQYIEPADEAIIRPYIQWALAEVPQADRQLILPQRLVKQFGAPQVLVAIKNHDRIVERRSAVPTRVVQVEQFVRNEWLAESLKSYYTYRCQICGYSFQPVYGVNFIETPTELAPCDTPACWHRAKPISPYDRPLSRLIQPIKKVLCSIVCATVAKTFPADAPWVPTDHSVPIPVSGAATKRTLCSRMPRPYGVVIR